MWCEPCDQELTVDDRHHPDHDPTPWGGELVTDPYDSPSYRSAA